MSSKSISFIKHRFKWSISFNYFIFIILLISLSDIVFLFSSHLYYDLFLQLVTYICLFLLPVYLFKNHLKTYYWLLFPIIILSSIAFSCLLFFNIRINPDVILLAVNTNVKEAMELSRGYILIYLLILLVILIVYIFLAVRLPSKIPARKSFFLSLTAAGIFLLLPFFQRNKESYYNRIKISLYSTFPNSLLYYVSKVHKMYGDMHNNEQARNLFHFNAKQARLPGLRQIYILIIGESSRAGQWAINGYYRNTTPRLLKRTNLVSFSNTVSGGYITEYAVPLLITEASPENFELQNREKSIVSAFKEAGFKTYWMSNQIDEGHILMHAKEADETYISMKAARLDMDIVDQELKKMLNKDEDKVFIVIHTWGSHWAYFERYPPAFDIFKPSAKYFNIRPSDITKKDMIINSYDNSILYSDAIIDTVIALTAQKNACSSVFYISDHGENLLGDINQKFLHDDNRPSKYVAHIPFFVWYSDKYKEIFPEKIKWLYTHKNQKIGAENIFPSLAEMGSLIFPSLDTTKSILNASFKDSQQKILGGESKVYEYANLLKE